MILTDDAALRAILQTPVSLAVLGAKEGDWEPAFYVPAYLHARGWQPIGVNPKLAGRPWLGAAAVASLAELPAPVVGVEIYVAPGEHQDAYALVHLWSDPLAAHRLAHEVNSRRLRALPGPHGERGHSLRAWVPSMHWS